MIESKNLANICTRVFSISLLCFPFFGFILHQTLSVREKMTGGTWPTRTLESKASEQKSSSLSEFVSASGKEPCLILWVPGSPRNSGSSGEGYCSESQLGLLPHSGSRDCPFCIYHCKMGRQPKMVFFIQGVCQHLRDKRGFLLIHCWIQLDKIFETFYIYVHERYWPVLSFFL